MRLAARLRAELARGAWAVAAAAACASGSGFPGPAPVAHLPDSPEAGAAFEAIRAAWADPARTTPETLRPMLEAFLDRFPRDDVTPVVRVALALVALEQGDFKTADEQLDRTAHLAPGAARDLWTIARAKRLRLRGDPGAALALLRPLVGKNVDPVASDVFEDELTRTAIATHEYDEAVTAMDTWLRSTPEEDKASAVARVTAIVAQLPKDVLVHAFRRMHADRLTPGFGADLARVLVARLVSIATSTGDAELARTLLDADADALVAGTGAALAELANSRRGLNLVDGRTVGLLLPTESPGLRDESADVLRGVMWALGLPRGARLGGAASKIDPRSDAGAGGCAPPEPAADADEPGPEEEVRLVTRDDAGSAARTEVSLDELAGEGAAVVIAGLDAKTSARALLWGEAHGVAVIALAPPDEPAEATKFGFVLGQSRKEVLDVLARAAPALDTQTPTPIVDASEIGAYPPQGGLFEGMKVGPPVSCDIAAPRAGDPRFPFKPSEGEKTPTWLVSGSPSCAEDLVSELSSERAHGLVALTLEAAALPPHPPGLRVVTAQAGIVPAPLPGDPRRDEAIRFAAALGAVGWWTALGRDASTLARFAVRGLPTNEVGDRGAVAERRATARDALASTRVRLWTTEAGGWAKAHTMPRTVCAVDVPVH